MSKQENGTASALRAPGETEARPSAAQWRVRERDGSVFIVRNGDTGKGLPRIVTTASHIIQCVEAHDALLAALDELLTTSERFVARATIPQKNWSTVMQVEAAHTQARAAKGA